MTMADTDLREPFRVIEGGRDWRADEAQVEVLAAFAEQIDDATVLHGALTALALDYDDDTRPTDLRWRDVLNVAGRIGERASKARDEYLGLTGQRA